MGIAQVRDQPYVRDHAGEGARWCPATENIVIYYTAVDGA